MVWKKASDAARDWCGGIDVKVLYSAVQRGKLRAAHYGAGRNLLFCEQWCTEWLVASAEKSTRLAPSASGDVVEMPPRGRDGGARSATTSEGSRYS
jgi:hypothetical protein